jgi:menaquinone-dependent protoporphyrinogen oxidase
MRVLIAVASHYGSTREIAEALAGTLRAAGHVVEVRNAAEVADAAPYDAVVLGSAIYNTAWLPEAAELARRNAGVLAHPPVWLFSVGSLSSNQGWPWGTLAKEEPREIAALQELIHPRDYHVFAGTVTPDRLPFVGRLVYRVLKGYCGDYRDWWEIDAWAQGIAQQLASGAAAPAQ